MYVVYQSGYGIIGNKKATAEEARADALAWTSRNAPEERAKIQNALITARVSTIAGEITITPVDSFPLWAE